MRSEPPIAHGVAARDGTREQKQSRLRVPLQQTLADAKLDVERARARLHGRSAPNVFMLPIAAGIVIAVVGSLFALSAALRANARAKAEGATPVPSVTQERTVDVDLER